MVADSIIDVRNRISAVSRRCGRGAEDVLLVAVSKTFGVDKLRQAIDAGQSDFGENYVQELQAKRGELSSPSIRWHYIGHLQSNKVKYIIDFVHLIQSVDNERVAQEIQRQAERVNRTVDILIEVHSTDEATKFGVLPSQAMELVKTISRLPRLNIFGLMTMGPFSDDPNDSRPAFQEVVHLGKRIEKEGIERVSMRHFSMGMTHDFEVGIEEGATIVRLGTAIFGNRTKALNEHTEVEL